MNGWVVALMLAAQALPKQDAVELRPRVNVSGTFELSRYARIHVDAIADALLAERTNVARESVRVNAIRADARDAWVEVGSTRADLRAGYGRLAWGRLDEVQPSDVINPIDTSRFFLDGRAEARLPVAFARARVFVTQSLTLEGVIVPFFRRSRFDSLDEETSPFNLAKDAELPPGTLAIGVTRIEPAREWRNVQGGGRVSATLGRVDVSASVYRGFRGFGDVTLEPVLVPGTLHLFAGAPVERYSRFTMLATDFETVTGPWAWRGEAAWFKDASFDIGAGVDRKTGAYRVFSSVIVHHDSASTATPARTNTNVVGSIERQFHRDQWLARAFVVANPADRSGFVRGLVSWSVSDRVGIDATAAKFLGTGDDTISKFAGRDFVMARIRYFLK